MTTVSASEITGSLLLRIAVLSVVVLLFQIGVVSEVPVFGVSIDLSPLQPFDSWEHLAHLRAIIAAKASYEGGNGLTDLLTAAEMDGLRKALAADGLPPEGAQALRPWFAAFMLAMPSCEKNRIAAGLAPLDQQIERAAIAK